jgi:AmmeMemoRadiSam system protein A
MEFKLSTEDRNDLLALARRTIEGYVHRTPGRQTNPDDFSDNLRTRCGAFVTLHEHGRLRGCIGHLVGDYPLYKMVEEMALSAALHDPRFYPVTAEELANIDIEISVLSPLRKITDTNEIVLGKHGILIQQGHHSGVFLPQVATETGWSLEEFLGHCSRDKAGLPWDGYKMADIYLFTAEIFSEGRY